MLRAVAGDPALSDSVSDSGAQEVQDSRLHLLLRRVLGLVDYLPALGQDQVGIVILAVITSRSVEQLEVSGVVDVEYRHRKPVLGLYLVAIGRRHRSGTKVVLYDHKVGFKTEAFVLLVALLDHLTGGYLAPASGAGKEEDPGGLAGTQVMHGIEGTCAAFERGWMNIIAHICAVGRGRRTGRLSFYAGIPDAAPTGVALAARATAAVPAAFGVFTVGLADALAILALVTRSTFHGGTGTLVRPATVVQGAGVQVVTGQLAGVVYTALIFVTCIPRADVLVVTQAVIGNVLAARQGLALVDGTRNPVVAIAAL